MKGHYYIIAGDYVNAISIWKSLKALQVGGSIYFLNLSGRNMAGRIFPKCRVIQGIANVDDLFNFLKTLEIKSTKFIFLTSELFHKALWENKKLLAELNVVVKIGNVDPSFIFDKITFLTAVRNNTNVPVPITYCPHEIRGINRPVFIKFKSSFISGKSVPNRGKDIYSVEELEKYLAYLGEIGFDSNEVEIQELLSTEAKDNVSVSGWYESGFHSLYQTRKLLQHPPKNGTGDVIEYMPLIEKLADYAIKILKMVDYEGPFEIEFIKERNGETYKVIEMNPRFWMQHGLIEQISGHLVVARYIGATPIQPELRYKYWLYPTISLLQIARGKLAYIPFFFNKNVYKPVSVSQSLRFFFSYLLKR